MYRLEIFDDQMVYVSSTMLDEDVLVEDDELTLAPYTLTVRPMAASKGWFTHLCRGAQVVADGIISDVQPGKETTTLSVKPLKALFEADVFLPAEIPDAAAWLSAQIEQWFAGAEDVSQRRPVRLATTMSGTLCPLAPDAGATTAKLTDLMARAMTVYGIVVDCRLNPAEKLVDVSVRRETATMTLEADLDNVLDRTVTLGSSYGAANKCILRRTQTDAETGEVTELEQRSFYLHSDGTVTEEDADRITPVFWALEDLEDCDTWDADALARAAEVLTPQSYDQEIVLAYRRDDRIARPTERSIGTAATIRLGGATHHSILTGRTYLGSTVELTFGCVRTELTKRLTMERRT